jgi:hypothetical protein
MSFNLRPLRAHLFVLRACWAGPRVLLPGARASACFRSGHLGELICALMTGSLAQGNYQRWAGPISIIDCYERVSC